MADSKLSSEQVLARSFDPATDKLKVDAEITATIGTVDVVIDAVGGDNIAIVNSVSGNELAIEADGSINANVTIDTTGLATDALQTTGNTKLDTINTTLNFKPATRLDEASATVSYVGEAAPGSLTSASVWLIKKIDETSGIVITFADGNSNYDNVWDSRASLTYA